jgi:hypothetical protein
MRRLLAAALLALAPATLSGAARAADPAGNFRIAGAGSAPCSAYSAATPQQKQFLETWLAGYATAMNRTTPDTYDLIGNMSIVQIHAWLADYCGKNPQQLLGIAVHLMLEAAYPNRVTKSPN